MSLVAVEKEPSEVIPLSADFSRSLEAGDSIISGNVTITAIDAVSDADVTSTLIVSGSKAVSGAIVSCKVQGGTLDRYYYVTINTGLTTLGHRYEPEITVAVVAAPAPTNMLVALPAVKRAIGITDTSQDDFLEDLIRWASSIVRNETGRQFSVRQYRETLRPSERAVELDLRYTPVLAIDGVTLESRDGNTVEALTATDVDFHPDGWIWRRDGAVWNRWPDKNIVTYRSGQPPPEDVVGTTRAIVSLLYGTAGKEGMTSEQIGDYVYRRAPLREVVGRGASIDPMIDRVLARYQQPIVIGA